MALKAEIYAGHETDRVAALQRFRRTVFVDQLGWDLVTRGDREVDQFDAPDAVHCALVDDGIIRAGFRATRTDRPYLAAAVFPALAIVAPYPCRSDIWEISRFGVLGEGDTRDLAKTNYALMFWFAARIRATALVAIAEIPYERFLRTLGIRTRRYGPPQEAGLDSRGRPFRLVAGEIPLTGQDAACLAAFSRLLDDVEIEDASEILGPSRVSA